MNLNTASKMRVQRSLVHIFYPTSRRVNGFEEPWDQFGVTLAYEGELGLPWDHFAIFGGSLWGDSRRHFGGPFGVRGWLSATSKRLCDT